MEPCRDDDVAADNQSPAAGDRSSPATTPPTYFDGDDDDAAMYDDVSISGEDEDEDDGAELSDPAAAAMANELNGTVAVDLSEESEHADGSIHAASSEGLHVDGESDLDEGAIIEGSSAERSLNGYAAAYYPSPEKEGGFFVADLVWGKVRSHPWWPGQIFHPSDASEKAMKYCRKDCYLVAYFGDRTFAWNEASLLKPFAEHFSEAERQSNSESFRNAVNCALEEVSRRVEFGLACSCVPEEVLDKIKFQTVENSGIRRESSVTGNIDKSSGVESFLPDKFVEYIKALAKSPSSGYDRLEVVIAKAQLSAFCRLKGHYSLPELQFDRRTSENGVDASESEDEKLSTRVEHMVLANSDKNISLDKGREASRKRKHNLKDIVYHRRRGKSVSELMGESVFCLDSDCESDEKDSSSYIPESPGKKRKIGADFVDDPSGHTSTRTISLAKVPDMATAKPRQSFKIGECIRRVASQLSGSPAVLRYNDESHKQLAQGDSDESLESFEESPDGHAASPPENPSMDQLLAKLNLTAQHPMKGHSFLNTIVSFFTEFRNSVVPTPSPLEASPVGKGTPRRKRKSSLSITELPETFEFDDVNDPYWKDMVVEHQSEQKVSHRGHRGHQGKERKPSTSDLEKPVRPRQKRQPKRQQDPEPDAEKPVKHEKKPDLLPTELIMKFSEVESVPSEGSLIQTFRYFGPLKESETVIDRETGCARVVFKRHSDAEVAYSSAAVFDLFGSVVSYKLDCESSISSKSSLLTITQGLGDAGS